MLKYRIRRARKERNKLNLNEDSIIASAYSDMVKAYESAIMFLNAERPSRPRKMTINDLFKAVCSVMDVSEADVISRNRKTSLVHVRATYCYLARLAGFQLEDIGRQMMRDHSTVIHHVKNYTAYLDEAEAWFRPDLKDEIDSIKHRLKTRLIVIK